MKLWNVPACTPIRSLRGTNRVRIFQFYCSRGNYAGHNDRVGGVAWHPRATLSQGPDLVNLASGAGDMNVHLWSLNRLVQSCLCLNSSDSMSSTSESPLSIMKGHQDRVCRVAFHPSGNYVASASFDTTWRLWDVDTSKELLLQEGHSKEVYSVEFQDDGALVASGYVLIYLPELIFMPHFA